MVNERCPGPVGDGGSPVAQDSGVAVDGLDGARTELTCACSRKTSEKGKPGESWGRKTTGLRSPTRDYDGRVAGALCTLTSRCLSLYAYRLPFPEPVVTCALPSL